MCMQAHNACHDDKKIAQNILKRYFRFAISILFCFIMSEISIRLLTGESHSFIEMLKCSFITFIRKGDNTFNNAFLVLSITFAYIFTRFVQKYIDVLIQKLIDFFNINDNVVKEG